MERLTTTPTRRAILTAAVAAPAIAAIGITAAKATLAASDASLFNQRLDAFKAANAAYLDLCAATPWPSDAVVYAACDVAGDAYLQMIATPAPSHPALIEKLAALYEWRSGSEIEEDEIRTILSDASRLAAREA